MLMSAVFPKLSQNKQFSKLLPFLLFVLLPFLLFAVLPFLPYAVLPFQMFALRPFALYTMQLLDGDIEGFIFFLNPRHHVLNLCLIVFHLWLLVQGR